MVIFKRIILVLLLVLPLFTFAQKAPKGSTEKKTVIKGISFSLGYSYGAITSSKGFVDQVITSKLTKDVNLGIDNITEIATPSFDVALEFSDKIELDFLFSYSHNHGTLEKISQVPSYLLPFTEDWFTLMPGVKWNWYNKKIGPTKNSILKLYSKANIGYSLANRYEIIQGGATINSAGSVAYQVVPFGLEVGSPIVRFFVEGGYGFTGYARAGIKFSINNNNTAAKNGIHGDGWYKDYLKMKNTK